MELNLHPKPQLQRHLGSVISSFLVSNLDDTVETE